MIRERRPAHSPATSGTSLVSLVRAESRPVNQPPFTCSRSRLTWRCSRSTVSASDAVDAEGAGAVPSLPFELTTTGWVAPPKVVALIPAMNVAVCCSALPIRIVPASPALPALAMSMLLEPVVRFLPALWPMATLADPVALSRALIPEATLLLPVVFEVSALGPLATLLMPVVLEWSALMPVATLSLPVGVVTSASSRWRCCRAGRVVERDRCAGRDVVVAGRVGAERVGPGRDVVDAGRVGASAGRRSRRWRRRWCWRPGRCRRWRRCRSRSCWRTAR